MILFDALKKYNDDKTLRFHMPGHKGKNIFPGVFNQLSYKDDVTEVEGLDNLHNPSGVLNELLLWVAEIYGVKRSFISTNGSTTSLQSAILGITEPGDSIIMSRNCHKSVYNSLILGDLNPIYIPSEYDEKIKLPWIQNLKKLEALVAANDKVKAIVITYPTYYGLCCDISEIVKIAHKYNKILIVDEAHGSHLKFYKELPVSAEEAGADIVIQSTHKTLPALTQSSVLHINSDIDIKRIENVLSMLLTSSPSYLLMSSIEKAISFVNEHGDKIHKYNIEYIEELKEKYPYAKIAYKDRKYFTDNGVYDFDNTKLIFNFSEFGINGKHAQNMLREKYNIEMEMSNLDYVNGFLTVSDNFEELDELFKSVNSLIENGKNEDYATNNNIIKLNIMPEIIVNIRKAFYSEKDTLDLDDAKEFVSGDYIIPYPPGIPLLCPGEKITAELLGIMKEYLKNDIEVIGIKDNQIRVLKQKHRSY